MELVRENFVTTPLPSASTPNSTRAKLLGQPNGPEIEKPKQDEIAANLWFVSESADLEPSIESSGRHFSFVPIRRCRRERTTRKAFQLQGTTPPVQLGTEATEPRNRSFAASSKLACASRNAATGWLSTEGRHIVAIRSAISAKFRRCQADHSDARAVHVRQSVLPAGTSRCHLMMILFHVTGTRSFTVRTINGWSPHCTVASLCCGSGSSHARSSSSPIPVHVYFQKLSCDPRPRLRTATEKAGIARQQRDPCRTRWSD